MSLLSVQNIGKSFSSYRSELHRFARWFGISAKPSEEHWVLRNVNFEIQPGEAVGIIGQNGAGKSTLLKMITGTLQPTEGRVEINGRIAAILELGMGFDPELTGRQNVFQAAGLMGFSSKKIQKVMPDIEAFAEIGEYFDEPVRTYSSGMQMRVAFGVATAYRPEILIIDEALSVGDSYFQHKSFGRIRKFQELGTTLLIVSHDPGAVKSMCNRAILLDNGMVIKEGKPEEIMDYYNALMAKKEETKIVQKVLGDRVETVSGTGELTFSNIQLYNENEELINTVRVGEAVEIHCEVVANRSVNSLVFGCGITDRLGLMMFGTNTLHTKQILHNVKKGDIFLYKISFLANLGVGSYAVHCSLLEDGSHIEKNFEWRDGALVFDVVNVDKKTFVGCMWNEMNFSVEKTKG